MKFSGERFIPQATDKEMQLEHMQRYYSVLSLIKDKVVLDAASGEGYGSYLLSQHAAEVHGVDISKETITHSKIQYQRSNLTYSVGSVDQLSLPDQSVDVVVSFETIEHVDESVQQSFLREIKRVLKPDGVLVISTPDKYIYSEIPNYTNPFHVKEFYREEFFDFLNSYFHNVHFYNQKFEVASLITDNKNQHTQNLLPSDQKTQNGKYIVAVCSDWPIDININSVLLNNEKYEFMVNRIVNLQNEVEERNLHIKNLDKHIAELDQNIALLQSQLNSTKALTEHANEAMSLLKQKEDNLLQALNLVQSMKEECGSLHSQLMEAKLQLNMVTEELKHKEEIINAMSTMHNELSTSIDSVHERFNDFSEKDQVIKNQLGHISQLLEQERRLNNILQSGGWKLLNEYYKYRDRILPDSSKRKFLAKLAFKTIKNPKVMIRSLNKQNLKKLKYYMKTEDSNLLENRLDNFVERHITVETNELQLFQEIDTSKKLVFEKHENPLVSIIIPVYNQWHYTYACLLSILENTRDIPYEVIIADDMSTDDTQNIVDVVENVVVIRDEVNRGFLRNCNNAAQSAKGQFIFFLNNDTNVQADWLKYLLDLIQSDASIGMVGSKLVYPDGRQQEAGGIIWKDASGWNYGRLDEPEKPEYNYVKEVDYISGAAIMIRTELWNQIGGFDDRYAPAYFEDSDLAFEVRKHGYKVLLQPKSVIVHFEGISHGTDTNSGIKSYQVKNKEKFKEKWKNVLFKEHFDNAENVFLARDRSYNKKTILVIDHYVPHFDKDAGSRTVYQYLQLFVKMGMNVKFIGDNFFKHEPYTAALEQLGIEVLYGNYYARNLEHWLKSNGKYIHYTYLNRPHISINYIDLIRKYTNSKVIYYGHDLHFLRELREYQLTGNEEIKNSSGDWEKLEMELFHKSDVIYYPSQVEVDEISKLAPELTVRAVPAYIYEDDDATITKPFHERSDILFVGGFGHKPNTDAVLWFVQKVFPQILSEIPDIKFYIVGSNPPDVVKNLISDNIIVTGFVTDEQLSEYYRNTKLVVVPLRYGAGVKGKVVEAMYNGAPIVTTRVGSEGLPGIEDYLIECDDSDTFAELVCTIYRDHNRLMDLSQKSKSYIKKYFSEESALNILSKDISY